MSAEVARLHCQLEKGEVARQNVELELVKVNKELAAEHRLRLELAADHQLRLERDAVSAETVQNLQRMLIFYRATLC